jgi:hypothetical protein
MRVEVAIFAVAFAVFGLVALALVWSGDWAYAALAHATGNTSGTFLDPGSTTTRRGDPIPMDLNALLNWHRWWATYVTGLNGGPPASPLFTPDEVSHMKDVAGVFRGAEIAAALAFVVAAYRVVRARRRGEALRLIRAGSLVAAAVVAVIGVAAAVAFDPLFLLFHELFFPQGNFLFAPDSNLLRLYPEWYWQGITAGVAVSFIALALLAAVAAQIALQRRSNTYTRAA